MTQTLPILGHPPQPQVPFVGLTSQPGLQHSPHIPKHSPSHAAPCSCHGCIDTPLLIPKSQTHALLHLFRLGSVLTSTGIFQTSPTRCMTLTLFFPTVAPFPGLSWLKKRSTKISAREVPRLCPTGPSPQFRFNLGSSCLLPSLRW